MTDFARELGGRVTQARTVSGLTQTELGERVTPPTPRMTLTDYRLAYTTTTLDITSELRTAIYPGVTIELRRIRLTDWPDGGRTIAADGRRVRRDGEYGRHNRTVAWTAPDPLPPVVHAIVGDARPGWWPTNTEETRNA